MTDSNGWPEYRELVMRELERLATEIRQERADFKRDMERLYTRLTDTEKKLATLEVRCGIWGLLGGVIPVATALLAKQL